MKYKIQLLFFVALAVISSGVNAKAISYYCNYPTHSDEDGLVTGDFSLELLSTGAVQTTTIDINNKSVHSRHTLMFGDLMPSQYYGRCKHEK